MNKYNYELFDIDYVIATIPTRHLVMFLTHNIIATYQMISSIAN